MNNPSKYFGIKKYVGDGTTDGSAKIKFPFSPDLAWLKCLSTGYDHRVFDRIRGQGSLVANKTDAQYSDDWSSLTTFDSDGISIEETSESYNATGQTYIAWAWDAGTAETSNDSGSIDIASGNQWVNTAAGFSISKYTGTGANASIGHGLGAKPAFTITKSTNRSDENWFVYHTDNSDAEKTLYLDLTNAPGDNSTYWNDTPPTSTVINLGTHNGLNASNDTYMTYAWIEIAGYSKFGKYTGNGAEDGTFVHTGFKPKYILLKKANTAGWPIIDSERCVANRSAFLYAHDHAAEFNNGGGEVLDFVSNGFKHRDSGGDTNGSSTTYFYAAFAEFPFKLSRAN